MTAATSHTLYRWATPQKSILDGASLHVKTLRQIVEKPADQLNSNELVDLVNLSAAVIKHDHLCPNPNILLSHGKITEKMANLGMAHLLTPIDQQAAVYLRAAPFAPNLKRRKILFLRAHYLPLLSTALKKFPICCSNITTYFGGNSMMVLPKNNNWPNYCYRWRSATDSRGLRLKCRAITLIFCLTANSWIIQNCNNCYNSYDSKHSFLFGTVKGQ